MVFSTVFSAVSPWVVGIISSVVGTVGGVLGWLWGSSAAFGTAITTVGTAFASSISCFFFGLISVLGCGVGFLLSKKDKNNN